MPPGSSAPSEAEIINSLSQRLAKFKLPKRVFLAGEWKFAGPLALTFVEFHRFTAVSYKLPLVDALVGTALLLAEYNGIERAGHVRDKLAWLIAYADNFRQPDTAPLVALRHVIESAARGAKPSFAFAAENLELGKALEQVGIRV